MARVSGARRWLARGVAMLVLARAVPAVAQPLPQTLPYRSFTQAFSDFATSTAALPLAERVAQFRTNFGRLFPAFYRPRSGITANQYDGIVARALLDFPRQQAGYEAVTRTFPADFAAELAHFRTVFPSFHPSGPIYLLHSLGEMDGGSRMIGKRRVLIFAADGISTLDTPDSVPMLLDHEFFHMAHAKSFPGCFAIWCEVWREGLATYAAAALHPGATDRQIALDFPVPLRPAVDAHWREAVCLLRDKLDASGSGPLRLFFRAGGGQGALPPRFGYYLGYRLAQRAATNRSLPSLMAQTMGPTHTMLRAEVAAMADEAGGCTPPALADNMISAAARPFSNPGAPDQ